MVRFSVPFVIAKGRPRVLRSGRTYTPKRTADAEKAIRDAYKGECVRRFGHVVTAPERSKVMVVATFQTVAPKSRPKWVPKILWDMGLVPFVTTPDVDNLIKCCMDALNPKVHRDKATKKTVVDEYVAWHDDSQVVEVHAYKLDMVRGGHDVTTVTVFWEDEERGESL